MTAMTARHPMLRWSVPGVAAVAVIAGGQIALHQPASAAPHLPARTAQQLLTDLLGAQPKGLSGTVTETADLGLPALPSAAGGGGDGTASPLGLLSGSHTLRVWHAAPDKARVAVLADGSETDAVTDGTSAWLWNSTDKTATQLQLPAKHAPNHSMPGGMAEQLTPSGIASWALRMLAPTTRVTVASNVTVAGRSAYQLTFTPKTADTRIGSIRVAIDASQHVPLRAQVYAKGSGSPAINVGFTKISFQVPPASRFHFTPPPGSTVHRMKPDNMRAPKPATQRPTTRVVGSGWSSVLVMSSPPGASGPGGKESQVSPQLLQVLPRVSGDWGSGHLLTSALFSAVITNDGRVAIGAVSPSRLYAALGRG